MSPTALTETALILVGHGATENPHSVRPVYRHAATLRQRGLFQQVLECFWMVPPFIADVWPRVQARHVCVVPVSISEGYFTGEVIPTALGLRAPDSREFARHQNLRGRTIHYCEPVGTHPQITDIILAHAESYPSPIPGAPLPDPLNTTLFLAGHGTPRNRSSRVAVEHQVKLIRTRRRYAAVQPAFMMEAPFIRDCWIAADTPDRVVVPFFISDGLHTREDIPMLLGEDPERVRERCARDAWGWINPTCRGDRRLWYTQAIGTDSRLADLILDRAHTALNSIPG